MPIPFVKSPEVQIYEEQKDPRDLRLKNLIQPYQGQKADLGLLGVPFDGGVILGGGRAGAREGPTAVRKALKRYGTAYNLEKGVDLSDLVLVDFGDLAMAVGTGAEVHRRLQAAVEGILEIGTLPLVIGGGHDLTYPDVAALARNLSDPGGRRGSFRGEEDPRAAGAGAERSPFRGEGPAEVMSESPKVGGINIDAHLDVREVVEGRITSGTPFRRVLEELGDRVLPSAFVEVGAQGDVSSWHYVQYLKGKGSALFPLEQVNRQGAEATMAQALEIAATGTDALFLSVDIDAIAQAFAPGCSAPSPRGLTPQQVWEMVFLAGTHPQVRLMDLMEINPQYDVDDRTARLGASILLAFLCGYKSSKLKAQSS